MDDSDIHTGNIQLKLRKFVVPDEGWRGNAYYAVKETVVDHTSLDK